MATIRKIKLKPGTVEIHTTATVGKQDTETVVKSYEEPHPDLVNAFADLAKSVYDLLQWPRDWMAGRVNVTGVSFSESDAGVRGAVITGQVALDTADAPFVFNTPHLPFSKPSPTAGGKVMPGPTVERLDRVAEAAADFLKGKRAQLELPGTKGGRR